LALTQVPVPAVPAAPVGGHPVPQGALVDPEVPGHLRDRLTRFTDQPHRAFPEVPVELPACFSRHRRSLPLRGSLHAGRGNPTDLPVSRWAGYSRPNGTRGRIPCAECPRRA